jgi:hypothetical protein
MIQKKSALLLAGLAALAYYKYNKMTPEEKTKIADGLKQTGKKLMDNLPGELKNIFAGSSSQETPAM